MSEKPLPRLVATRISEEHFKVLQVGLVVNEASTMQELLRPVIEDFVAALLDEPEVVAILDEASGYRDRKAGVSRIGKAAPQKRKKVNREHGGKARKPT